MPRLLAVGDLHGDTAPLFRLLDAEPWDVLLCVGDWGDAGEVGAEAWDTLLARLSVATVSGNHDDLPFLENLRNHDGSNVLLAPGETRRFCGLTLAGVSGIWAKSHKKPYYITDEEVAEQAAQLAATDPPVDILLTHGCPIGIADRTLSGRPGGQKCFLDLLQTVRPRVHLCGHLHVAQRRDLSDPPCAVLNTGSLRDGSYVVLETGANSVLSAALNRV